MGVDKGYTVRNANQAALNNVLTIFVMVVEYASFVVRVSMGNTVIRTVRDVYMDCVT